jgi:hypothetical protein
MKGQTTTAGFTGFFEVGVGRPFLEIEAGKGTRSTRVLRRRLRASGGRGDPDGREELQRVHVPDAAYSLAPSSPSPAINSPCEEGCCSRDYEQDASCRVAVLTARDCRRHSSAVFCTRQRHSGTAAREQLAHRHKTVARLPTVADVASE